jgi:hypothetical protein
VCGFLAAAYPDVYWYAIPNGGRRDRREARRLKDEGARKGVPDLCIARAVPPWHGLYIEMKRRAGGQVRREQRDAMDWLARAGYRAEVCRGADEAITMIKEYLDAES